MKTLPLLALSCLCSSAVAQDASADYLNFIIQIQSDVNRTTHKLDDVNPEGSSKALEGVFGSSVFQLWTIHRTKGTEYLLDEKIVSSYHPEASITIQTNDPYTVIPRTRVDQPFTMTTTVSGLITNDPKVQDAAKSVILQHTTKNYFTQLVQNIVNLTPNPNDVHGMIDKNGTTSETRLTILSGTDLTRVSGEEEFAIYSHPDYGIDEPYLLAKGLVQIWPIARASMRGIDSDTEYIKLPNLHIELEDLYPDSTTYVRVYEGSPKPNPTNPFIINTSFVKINDTTTQDRKFSIAGKELGITQKGSYTVEVLHETPFGIDILKQIYPLNVKTDIKVIGALHTSE